MIMNLPSWMLLLGAIPIVLLVALLIFVAVVFSSRPNSHGAARWAKPGAIKSFYKDTGPILGCDEKGRILRASGDAPLISVMPARSGKGSGQIIPTLLLHEQSIVVLDPKGEACRAAVVRRQSLGDVFVLDPFSITGAEPSHYNPLAGLADSPLVVEDSMALADALCPVVGSGASEHFSASARSLIRALILFVVTTSPAEKRNLVEVRRILNQSANDVRATLHMMSGHPLEPVHGPARQQLAREEREAAGVLSTAATNTEWLDSPRVAGSLARSDLSFADLKKKSGTVFIVLPPTQLVTFSRWLRILTVSIVREFSADPLPGNGSLFIVDEAAALGRIKALEDAYAVLPGYGLRAWSFWQSASQLEDVYGHRAKDFFANSGTQIYSDISDDTTSKQLSAQLGNETVLIGQKPNVQRVARPLLAPELVRQHRGLIILERGKPPMRARKIRWWEDKQMASLGQNERA